MTTQHEDFWFLAMADTQFGMFASFAARDAEAIARSKLRGLEPPPEAVSATGIEMECALYEQAIAAANRLRPDFATICGDLINDQGDPEQLEALFSITARLDQSIPMRWVAGNHDCGLTPTHASIADYRQRFGDDNYFFDHKGTRFVVFNSSVWFDPSEVPDELASQEAFLHRALAEGRNNGAAHLVVLHHHPTFVKHSLEADDWMVIPGERRRVLLDILEEYGVSLSISGHLHRNQIARYGDIQLVSTGPVGCPLGADPSGVRVVKVYEDRIEHEYFAMDRIPDSIIL